MPFELWFAFDFKKAKTTEEKRYYEGYWEGYIAYHDANIDRVERGNRHEVRFDWVDNDSKVKVFLNPLLNREDFQVTYSSPAVVTAAAASSDPPLPPPPKG